eukprot:TRINITY_DN93421_c0_g1_i8.p1 TRINITY_DN93421_c0_g1~~TRINITY_DN93421_c0_g1_i8.p1  ORF type:complete len:138 (-),score=33.61 TRINITY_DN93421_c0_g1_i8:10-423(-)
MYKLISSFNLCCSSEFSIVHNSVEKKQKMIMENRQSVKVCTGEAASRLSGLELCGELQFPNASSRVSGPYFPFTGPTSLSLALYKRDTHTSYKLLAKRVEVRALRHHTLLLNRNCFSDCTLQAHTVLLKETASVIAH